MVAQIDDASILDFCLENGAPVHSNRWVPHVDHVKHLLRQDNQDEYGDCQGNDRPKQSIVSLPTLKVQGESVTEAVLTE